MKATLLHPLMSSTMSRHMVYQAMPRFAMRDDHWYISSCA